MEPVHRSKLNTTLYFEMCLLISEELLLEDSLSLSGSTQAIETTVNVHRQTDYTNVKHTSEPMFVSCRLYWNFQRSKDLGAKNSSCTLYCALQNSRQWNLLDLHPGNIGSFFLGLGLECKNGHKKFNKALSIYINRLVKVLLRSY